MTTRLATILRNALGVVAVLLTVTTGRAATPSFDSFDTNDFRVVKTTAPWKILSNTANTTNNFTNVVVNYINSTIINTNTIITNVNTTIVNTNTTIVNQGDTIINTNVTQVSNYTTNFIDNSVITITNTVINITNTVININGNTNGVGSLNPTIGVVPYKDSTNSFGDSPITVVTPFEISVQSIVDQDFLSSGRYVQHSKVINLALGTNQIPAADYSQFILISPTNDPAQVTIQLDAGYDTVQHLEIFNFTNAPNTGKFTLPANSAVPGGGLVKLLGDQSWTGTNGMGIILRFVSPDWIEMGRFNLASVAPTADLWTNNAGVLEPVDLTLPLMITNQIRFGPGSTNVLYRSGSDLVYTNDSTDVKFEVKNNAGTILSVEAQSLTGVLSAGGSANAVGLRQGANQVLLANSGWYPVPGSSQSLGIQGNQWLDYNISGTGYTYGYLTNTTNYSRLAVHHSGTNGSIIFDSQSAGSGGLPRNISFQTNGVERAFIHLDSEQIGVTTAGGVTGGFMQAGTGAFSLLSDGTALVLHNSAAELQFSSNQLIPSVATMTLGGNGVPFHQVWTDQILLTGITKAQKTALTPIDGMIVYQTDNTPGIRAYINGAWVILNTSADP